HSIHGEAFNEGPRRKATLMPGMGKIGFEFTTKAPEAKAFFLQGVGQLHGFYYFESERSFRQVAFLDPDCAMAYWGMAMSNINNEKRAKEFLARAEALQGHSSRREQMWIQSLTDYYKVPPAEKERRARAYVRGLEAIVQDFPADLEAKAFLAWCIWFHKDKGLPIGSSQAVESILQEVLRAEPMHNGVHHYRIHLWDEDRASIALDSAERFGPSSPGIAHAWHMPGHIYSKLHRYADAARQQEASARVDHAHMIDEATMPYQIHNYAHNNQWCVTDLGYVGRIADAIALAENLITVPRHPKLNHNDQSESCFRIGRARLMETCLKWELWEELASRAETTLAAIETRDDRVLRLRALGAAGFNLRHPESGRKAISELEELSAREPAPAESDPKKKEESEKARDRKDKPIRNALEELRGWARTAEGDPKGALEHFAKCEDLRKEVLAQAELRAGQPEKAEKTAKQAMNSAPGQLYPLAAYLEILGAQGKKDEAALQNFRDLGVFADPELPILKRLGAAGLGRPAAKAWPDQSPLGPLTWRPSIASFWSLSDRTGGTFHLEAAAQNPVLVLFYLGSKCQHCVEQLTAFAAIHEEYQKAGISIVAVSTESGEEIRKACEDPKKTFPFLMLADPAKRVFKQYHCWDDFENVPLHGTFLIDAKDPAHGRLRWQDISYEPFMDAKFLLEEVRRLLALRTP
ncbi:MAG TPA: redoxin domain-containing protein, partial [Planctomycetota bacterium]|nr:redoxin domain-containing protein [Planctomycetota bacterium]